MNVDVLHRLVANIDYPMLIVTTVAGGRRAGCLVGFATQCSVDPPRLLVCLSRRNHTFNVAAEADFLAVHFIGVEDMDLATLFGEQTGDDVDKFSAVEWSEGPEGLPILAVQRGWLAGRVLERFDVGDHVAYVLETFAGEDHNRHAPSLTFQQVRMMVPGHEP